MQAPRAGEGNTASRPATAATASPAPSLPAPAASLPALSGSAEPAIEEVAATQLDESSRQALAARLLKLLDSDSFCLFSFDRLNGGLERARQYLALPPHDASKTSQYVGLGLLRLSSYAEIDKPVRAGLPRAILEALALDDDSGPRILGAVEWQRVRSRYAAGIAEAETKRGDDAMIVSRAPTRGGMGRAFIVAPVLGALVGLMIFFVVTMIQPPRVVSSTLVSPVRAAPANVPLSAAMPALPEGHQEASTEPLQAFVPPPESESGDLLQRP